MGELWEYLAGGGALMLPLGLLSGWMWALIARKALELRRLGREDPRALAAPSLPGRRLGEQEALRLYLRRRRRSLEEGIALIRVLAGLSPLLGLLGTVRGMILAFWSISLYGTGNPRALAVGISEALITTQTGLLVAIPGMFAVGLLGRRLQARCAELEVRWGLRRD